MEFLAGLYTLLLVTICLLLAVVLWKLNKPRNGGDYEELKRCLQQQLDAQAKDFAARQAAMAEQNYTAIRSVSETLQTSVQSMSTTLAQGQRGQQQILPPRLQSLEAANTQKLEELRKPLAENMTALQAENAKKLDEIRHTVDEQLQDALQKRVTESFKAVNDQLEQVYKGLGEMQRLAADVVQGGWQYLYTDGTHGPVQRYPAAVYAGAAVQSYWIMEQLAVQDAALGLPHDALYRCTLTLQLSAFCYATVSGLPPETQQAVFRLCCALYAKALPQEGALPRRARWGARARRQQDFGLWCRYGRRFQLL